MKQYEVFISNSTDSGQWINAKGEELEIPNPAGVAPILCVIDTKGEYKYRLFDKNSGIPLCLSFREQEKERVIKDVAYKINTHIKTPQALTDTISAYAESMQGYKTNNHA